MTDKKNKRKARRKQLPGPPKHRMMTDPPKSKAVGQEEADNASD